MVVESFIIVIYILHCILYIYVYTVHNIIRNEKKCTVSSQFSGSQKGGIVVKGQYQVEKTGTNNLQVS